MTKKILRVPCRACPWLIAPNANSCPHCGDVRRIPLLTGNSAFMMSSFSMAIAAMALAIKLTPGKPDLTLAVELLGNYTIAVLLLVLVASWLHKTCAERKLAK